jgi:hypothetical protein
MLAEYHARSLAQRLLLTEAIALTGRTSRGSAKRTTMSPTIFSSTNTFLRSSGTLSVSTVGSEAPPKSSSSQTTGSSSTTTPPGLNSVSDQPLSPQVYAELMKLYASLHGATA